MSTSKPPKQLCCEIAGELRDLAAWLGTGKLDPERFSMAVLELETAKVNRYGFTLTASNSAAGVTEFILRFADSGKICTRMEFDSHNGELSVVHLCETAGRSRCD